MVEHIGRQRHCRTCWMIGPLRNMLEYEGIAEYAGI